MWIADEFNILSNVNLNVAAGIIAALVILALLWAHGRGESDGIDSEPELPTDVWDDVPGDLQRTDVPGGWLYRDDYTGSIAFVPKERR